jgi:hypothetical protein
MSVKQSPIVTNFLCKVDSLYLATKGAVPATSAWFAVLRMVENPPASELEAPKVASSWLVAPLPRHILA